MIPSASGTVPPDLLRESFDALIRLIRSEDDMEETLEALLGRIVDFFGLKGGAVLLADPAGSSLDAVAVLGEEISGGRRGRHVRSGEGVAGRVLLSGEPLSIEATDPSAEADRCLLGAEFRTGERLLAVPLRTKSGVYGVVDLLLPSGRPFGPPEEALLRSVTDPVAVILENHALVRSKENDLRSLRTLMQVNRFINTTIDLQSLLNYIMAAAKSLLAAEGSSLLLLDEATQELHFNIVELDAEGNKERLKEIRLPVGVGIAGLVAKTGQPMIVNDAQNDRRVFRKADELTSFRTRNILAVPMKVQDRLIGVLQVVNSVGRDAFAEADLKLLASLAEQAGIAIHNRTLIDSLRQANTQLERRIRELTAIYRVSRSIGRNLGYQTEELLKDVIRILSETLRVERVSVFLHEGTDDTLRAVAALGIPPEQLAETVQRTADGKIMGRVFRTGTPLLVEDIRLRPELGRFKRLRYRTPSFVCLPLRIKDRIVGVLNLADKADGKPFGPEDLATVETIAIQVGEAYENSLFYREVLEKQRMEKELEVANAIQRHILAREFPAAEGLDVVGSSVPAHEIGGDFYDCLRIDGDRTVVYVADVSGKGVPAAIFMALSHSILRVVVPNNPEPAEALHQANRFILSDSKNGMFVTLFYLLIDTRRRVLRFASAGHNEQLHYDRTAGRFRLLKTRGVPLGVSAGAVYRTAEVPYGSGDFVLLFTDGVLEAQDDRRTEYGLERLMRAAAAAKDLPARDILETVRQDIESFRGTARLFDDLTLFAVRLP